MLEILVMESRVAAELLVDCQALVVVQKKDQARIQILPLKPPNRPVLRGLGGVRLSLPVLLAALPQLLRCQPVNLPK